jgi:hypothetical protein
MASWTARKWFCTVFQAPWVGMPARVNRKGGQIGLPGGSPAERRSPAQRLGAATLDYVLILAVILPLVLISIFLSRQILGLAYEFLCVLVAWPFM